jgi:hypothetical protein
LFVLLLAPGAPAAAQDKGPNGLDYFRTRPNGAVFDFRGDLALPAGFFDEGSSRFSGRIPFTGVPLKRFEGTETGNADTVVRRRETPTLGPKLPSRGSAQIELVALSLRSTKPIAVKVGGKTQTWDVKLALSKGRASSGKMEIVQTSRRGGTFSSEFVVVPVLTFVRRSDKAERTLDVGTMKLSPEAEKSLTLRASGAPWSVKAPKGAVAATATFNAGVLQNGNIAVIRHNASKHVVVFATRIPDLGPGPVEH